MLKPSRKRIQVLERICYLVGALLLVTFIYLKAHSYFLSRAGIHDFQQARVAVQTGTYPEPAVSVPTESLDGKRLIVDYSLWSPARVRAYEASLKLKPDAPIGVLRVPKIRLEVPVYEGTDDLTLDRGAGRIVGTGVPGEPGNLAIAGHRDGFFRGLKDLVIGDPIQLDSLSNEATYTVESIKIVKPDDVSVLQPTTTPVLTLVTCYPFYYVGSAPQRYIIKAALTSLTPVVNLQKLQPSGPGGAGNGLVRTQPASQENRR